jgi:hypothetical protein
MIGFLHGHAANTRRKSKKPYTLLKRLLTAQVVRNYAAAPDEARKAFDKQAKLLTENLTTPHSGPRNTFGRRE